MRGSPSLRKSIYDQLEAERPDKRGLSPTNWCILFLILFSLVLYTAETEREIDVASRSLFWLLNYAVLTVFAVEFVGRLYAIGTVERFRGWRGLTTYARSNWFLLTVDFLAFAPELVLMLVGLNPPGVLRALRLVRLFKLIRYFPAFRLVVDALRSCLQELLAALAVAVMLWYVSSVLLYLAEGGVQPDEFGSITRSMWWSVVTLTTIGYGDVYPVTVIGKILAGGIAVLGVGAVALPSGILAGAFIEKFRNRHDAS